MLRTVPMQKIRIVALKSAEYDIIRELQKAGMVQIKKSKMSLEDDKELGQISAISELLVKFRSALSFIKSKKRDAKQMQQMELQELISRCRSERYVEEINALVERRRSLADRLKITEDALANAQQLEGIDVDFGTLASKALAFRAFIADTAAAGELEKLVEKKGLRGEVIESRKGKRATLFVAYDASQRSALDDIAAKLRLKEIDMNESYLNAKPSVIIDRLKKERDSESKDIEDAEHRLAKIGDERYPEIAGLTEMLEAEYERAQVSAKFKSTARTFVLEGWAPKKSLDALRDRMKDATRQNFVIEEINDGEKAPTLLGRGRFFGQFDFLMGFYSLPRSDEIDPTWFFVFSFMIFYGMMISDVGYGVMSLILGAFLAKKFPDGLMNSVAKVWMMASIPIIFFGLISNQFFGLSFAPFKGIMLIDWTNNVTGLLALTVIMGLTQVTIGLALGFFDELMHHEPKLAVSKLTSIIAVIGGTVAITGALFGIFSSFAMPAAAIAALASVATIALSGIEGVEFTNLISHPLSYTRIFGFGLASIILASLIDKAFTPTLSSGVIAFVGVSVIFLLLHAMNMLLSIFEGLVQATRLNFIEFFTKFYTGGGEKFTPYHFNRRYTKE